MNDLLIHDLLDIGMLSLLVLTSLAIIKVHNLLIDTILLSIFSLIMASMYLIMGAPDVAMTEAAIGAGISTLLFLAVLLVTGEQEKRYKHPYIPIFLMAITGLALVYATLGLPHFGDPQAVANHHVVPHYLQESQKEMGIPNVVTSILASYRGFDTMGEAFVIFTAGISVLMLLGGGKEKSKAD